MMTVTIEQRPIAFLMKKKEIRERKWVEQETNTWGASLYLNKSVNFLICFQSGLQNLRIILGNLRNQGSIYRTQPFSTKILDKYIDEYLKQINQMSSGYKSFMPEKKAVCGNLNGNFEGQIFWLKWRFMTSQIPLSFRQPRFQVDLLVMPIDFSLHATHLVCSVQVLKTKRLCVYCFYVFTFFVSSFAIIAIKQNVNEKNKFQLFPIQYGSNFSNWIQSSSRSGSFGAKLV